MSDWRLVTGAGDGGLDPVPGARNMAVDHALFEAVQAGGPPVLRLYRWQPACLSFGRNQRAAGVYDPARLRRAGVDAVRRPTGGLAVLHDLELTYCVLIPAHALGGPRGTYRRINEGLVAGLCRLGVPARVAEGGGPGDPSRDAALPCFHAPAEGEVVAAGMKLVGSAQRCERHTLLQHGSILLDGSQRHVLDLLCDGPAPGAASGSVTLRELLGAAPPVERVAHAVATGIEEVCGIRLAPATLTREEEDRAARLQLTYADAAWTWRR